MIWFLVALMGYLALSVPAIRIENLVAVRLGFNRPFPPDEAIGGLACWPILLALAIIAVPVLFLAFGVVLIVEHFPWLGIGRVLAGRRGR